MNRFLHKVNQFFERVPDTMRKYRYRVWTAFILITVILALFANRLEIDMSMDAYFQEDDPVRVAFDSLKMQFEGPTAIYIAYKAKDGDVFSDASLKAIQGIQDDLLNYRLKLKPEEKSELDHITDVKTLINVSYIDVREDSLVSRQFIGTRLPATEEERERLRQQALDHPDYPLVYLSKDSKYGGIMIRTDFGAIPEDDQDDTSGPVNVASADSALSLDDEGDENLATGVEDMEIIEGSGIKNRTKFKETSMPDYAAFMREVNATLNKPNYTKSLVFYPAGEPVVFGHINDVMIPEFNRMFVGFFIVVALMFLVLFRSFSAVIWPLMIVVLSILWVMGLIGWSGAKMTTLVYIIIYLVLVIGIADAVHILSGYLYFRNQKQGHNAAMRSVFKKSGLACFLTSVTTAIGMSSLVFVPIVPMRNMGIFSALGVLFAFIITVFLLPLMLDLWKPFSKKRALQVSASGQQKHIIQKLLRKIEPISYRYPIPIIMIFAVCGIFLIYGTSKVRVDSNLLDIMPEETSIRKAYDLVDHFMGGTQNMEILVQTGHADAMKDPRVLNAVESLQAYMETKYKEWVVDTYSLVNVTKESFKALNEGRQEMYIIPQDPVMLEQTLIMFNSANPRDRQLLVTDDYSTGRITFNLKTMGSRTQEMLMNDVQAYIDQSFAPLKKIYPNLDVIVTGSIALGIKLINYISWSQIRSFGLALVVISLIFFVIFGSKKVGFISIMPNLFPILTIFGTMGYLDIPLDTDTLLIAPMTIGIIVDDTIHFLTHYRAEIHEHGDIRKAVVNSFREAGQAIVFTTIILSLSFLNLLTVSHKGMNHIGILSALAFFTALICDLFLLPSLLKLFKVRFGVVEGRVANYSIS